MTSTENRAVDDSTQVSDVEDFKPDHEVIDQALLAGNALEVIKRQCVDGCTLDNEGCGKLIACDASGCLIEWYHIECVGLTLETMLDEDDGWICPPCKLAEKETEKCIQEQAARAKKSQPPSMTTIPKKPEKKDGLSLGLFLNKSKNLSKDRATFQNSVSGGAMDTSVESELDRVLTHQRQVELVQAQAKLQKSEKELQTVQHSLDSDSVVPAIEKSSTTILRSTDNDVSSFCTMLGKMLREAASDS